MALVIGNSDYQREKLKNPKNDAKDMTDFLKSKRFYVENYDFWEKHPNSEVALFYYSGHGVGSNNRNYLIPTNNRFFDRMSFSNRDRLLERKTIDLDDVQAYMTNESNKLNIIIIDACRNEPLSADDSHLSKTRQIKRLKNKNDFKNISTSDQVVAIYSTHFNGTADDNSDERNGLFTKHFLEHAKESHRDLVTLVANVQSDVVRASNSEQKPKIQGDPIGMTQFSFTPENQQKFFSLDFKISPEDAKIELFKDSENGNKLFFSNRDKLIQNSYYVKISKSGYKQIAGYVELNQDKYYDLKLIKLPESQFKFTKPVKPKIDENKAQAFLKYPRKYTRNSNGVVSDGYGLEWEDHKPSFKGNFDQAKNYCENLNLDGKTDWRLPNLKELWYLADRTKYNPAISPVFKNVKNQNIGQINK